ncbi:DNA alkylation repair protein [Paenibacillus sp. OV219]|uniref:DNA alkylation repair protein n=1 Tax=Paenibacillus sp. OV219 TaxID=1884377 RepID=UPI0008CD322B|nr:DNA alkylation repair protein [Paenibacillus sp. OV219]SEO41311.1 3-methyladenine DNA glycosylase AlkC [Paenibacillus sp. OV219]
MAEPLKAMYDLPFLRQFAARVASAWAPFEQEAFIRLVMGDGWEALELKGRIRRITHALGATLPASYPEALGVLLAIHEQCAGFPYLFFPDFVEVYGLEEQHHERSLDALARFTVQSSAEFAIRPFLMQAPGRTLARMMEWALSPNEHVRRLASEGCRPRLPWAPALTIYKKDPSPIVPLLELLKCDPSLYVRKSVANNLNDIAKDHPTIVREIAKRWSGHHQWTDWIVRHGCRTLIKAADPEIMALFGYEEHSVDAEGFVEHAELQTLSQEVRIGEESELRYEVKLRQSQSAELLRLRVELGVFYVKSGGKVSEKRFLVTDKKAAPGTSFSGAKKLSWKELSTRKHYEGLHRLTLVVNGLAVAETNIQLSESVIRSGVE